ncbi:MAG TPA: hypothetical protein VHS58_11905 [Acetobacteraceae bacterium]|jgi:hypothetical protein|nr:hypothetical protein [Acetobacteraceae bacterium]
MRAFAKTLVGDGWNVSVVTAVILVEAVLAFAGAADAAAFVIPPLTLAGVAWLARH